MTVIPLSKTEVGVKARAFADTWAGESSETGEKQTFWNQLFEVFGLDRRTSGARYELPAKKQKSGGTGFIDVYAGTQFLCEHKTLGKSLDDAEDQAWDYHGPLPTAAKSRYIVVSDFGRFRIVDTEKRGKARTTEFTLEEFGDNPDLLRPIFDAAASTTAIEVLVNTTAAELMADLLDEMNRSAFSGHELAMWLTRTLFCLYAEDSGIFDSTVFTQTVKDTPAVSLGATLQEFFRTLDTPKDARSSKPAQTGPPCPTSTAACSPTSALHRPSTPRCVRRCSGCATTTGSGSTPPSSAPCSRTPRTRRSVASWASTTHPRRTSSRPSSRSSWMTSGGN